MKNWSKKAAGKSAVKLALSLVAGIAIYGLAANAAWSEAKLNDSVIKDDAGPTMAGATGTGGNPGAANAVVPPKTKDAMTMPALQDTRIEGYLGQKVDRFLDRRVFSGYARNVMFAEAEKAFDTCFDDDPSHPGAGFWQGEYWGKEMLGAY